MADSEDQKSYYEQGGKQYPRVTHILKIIDKPGLARWRGRLGNSEADNVSREGSRIGTEFHSLVSDINRGIHQTRGWQAPGEFRFMAQAYIDWLHHNVREVVDIERTYFSDGVAAPDDEPLYAGTMDLLAYFRSDSIPSIIDLKTSNYVSADWPLQLSAYRRLLANNGVPTLRRVIVRIPKKGKIEPEMYDYSRIPGADEADEEAWRLSLKLWQWMQKDKERSKSALVVAGL